MGMFDYITCEYPLPDNGPQDEVYQTKDTDAMYLEEYRITREGRLVCGGLDTNHHGALHFYTDKNGEWFEYICLFKDGSLIDIRRAKAEEEQ